MYTYDECCKAVREIRERLRDLSTKSINPTRLDLKRLYIQAEDLYIKLTELEDDLRSNTDNLLEDNLDQAQNEIGALKKEANKTARSLEEGALLREFLQLLQKKDERTGAIFWALSVDDRSLVKRLGLWPDSQ